MRRRASWAVVLLVVTAACSSPAAGPVAPSPAPTEQPSVRATPAPVESSAPPAVAPTPAPTPVPVVDRTALVARLGAAVATVPVGVEVSLAVLDHAGEQVFVLEGDRPLLPASTAKLVPGAAALLVLGPDGTLPTRVERVGRLGEDGVLSGQLVLVGGGDPALSEADYRKLVYVARPHTALEELADAVVAAGIEVVTGGVVAGPDLFGETPEAPGWKPDYLAVLDARRITGLTVNAGLAMTVRKPAPEPELELLASPDPTATALATFRRLLTERGVVLWPESSVVGDAAPSVVAEVRSPPVRELVRFALERSDNQTADTLFRLVGTELGEQGWEGAGRAARTVVASLGVSPQGMVLADGSGLSRDDRLTARQLAGIDRAMRAGRHGEVWRDVLAEAGKEGTLRRRLRGTVAEGRFLGKTGTLDDVTAVAGTVEDPTGRPAFHVAAIANVGPGVGRFGVLVVFDDVIALLAEEAAGCVRTPPPTTAEGDIVVGGLHVSCPP